MEGHSAMVNLVRCILYFALIGASGFIIGRVVPKSVFSGERFPFRLFRWEKQGRVYELIGIRKWKEKLPDMSVILPKLMPSKKMPNGASSADVELMIQETCVAELTHGALCAAGFGCVLIWKGIWGWVVSILYCLANIPFILIQRYNRPKLMRILTKIQAKERVHEKCDNFELQHGTGA